MLDFKMKYGGTWNQMQKQMRDVVLPLTAHMRFAAKHIIHDEYSYDSTDDGPEVELITRILAADWYYEIENERSESFNRSLPNEQKDRG